MKLETERLIIRDYEDKDVADLVEGLNNINVSKWLGRVPYPYTKEHALNTIKNAKLQQLSNPRTLYNFVIELKENGKVIGGTSLCVDLVNLVGSGGIWINENYHGHGYGKEAFNKRIEFAFNKLGLRKIENGFFKGNESSKKMQLSLGYKIEGTRRKNYICKADGKIKSEVLTGLLKEEWVCFKKNEVKK